MHIFFFRMKSIINHCFIFNDLVSKTVLENLNDKDFTCITNDTDLNDKITEVSSSVDHSNKLIEHRCCTNYSHNCFPR